MNSTLRTVLIVGVTSILAVALRLGMWLPNVKPLGSLGLYSGSRMRLWLAWVPAIGVMLVTDWLLRYSPSWPTYACFVIDALIGYVVIRKITVARIGGAAFLSALQFYLITNFFVWLYSSPLPTPHGYPKTLAGLIECYTLALPFFGYTLIGNLGFCAAMFGADAFLARSAAPAPIAESGAQ
jgi:hypothetical protein